MYERMYVCTYVCVYVRMYVRMFVCMYVCMYVCELFFDYLSKSNSVASRNTKLMNDEFERIWKASIVLPYDVIQILLYFPGYTEENHAISVRMIDDNQDSKQ